MYKTIILIFLFLNIQVNSFSQNGQNIRISLKDQLSNAPLAGATVKISKHNLNQTADDAGKVVFNNVPLGRLELEISSVGYEKVLVKELLLESSKELVLNISLMPASTSLSPLTVKSTSTNVSQALTGITPLSMEQVMRFPATFFDPARLAFSLAGVANNNDQANGMSVRGNTPDALQWRLEGVEIVNPNHFSNAGTYSDQPTQSGGGTNILSSQMLGNMNFLSGSFPADYSNSLGGVMDMYFKEGNATKYQHTAQIGLVGIDLSSEGPINKSKGSSYLFNYRYSFTGLLVAMGMDFGGEKMKFQDIAANFCFPTKKAGAFSFFLMGGNSSNIFAPPTDKTQWESEKDFNNIDFFSRMGVVGMKHKISFGKTWFLQTVLANSGLENLRSQYTTDPSSNLSYRYHARNVVGFSSALTGKLNKTFTLKTGINLNHFFNEFNQSNSDNVFVAFDEFLVSPFFKIINSEKRKFSYNLGITFPVYNGGQYAYVEPRLGMAYEVTPKITLKGSYGLHSFQPNSRLAFTLPFKPQRAHHFAVGYSISSGLNDEFFGEVFYQNIFNTPQFTRLFVSVLNGSDFWGYTLNPTPDSKSTQGINQGIELNYRRHLTKGLFALINTTFYKSEFKAYDGKYYETRFSGRHIFNLTFGKEWEKKNGKIIGLNTRIAWLGGFRDYNIDVEQSKSLGFTVYDFSKPLEVRNSDYFRPDLRVYFKKSKKNRSRMISMDIQNFVNQKNVAYKYYDSYLKETVTKYQLGMIPMLNYRWEF